MRKWWKEGIVYQIYPRSFNDTTGNGIGDLRGIIDKLDYIAALGVDIIWLNPIYDSPNDDNGYDIRDYRTILEEFGTMADFDELLHGMHQRGLKLLMDLVVNHSSDEHQWFLESKKNRDNPYRDYYHWWPAEDGQPPKRWSYFDEESNAWKYDSESNAYYLHYFSEKQPDLNWENPKLREDVYEMMKFWFDKGVDGFRMDVISFISKDTTWPTLAHSASPDDYITFYAHGPRLHDYLHEMHNQVLAHYDIMTVGEAPGIQIDEALDLVGEDRKELDMFFHFDLMTLDRSEEEVFKMNPNGWSLDDFKRIFTDWDLAFSEKGWGSLFLNNHDFPRTVSRWGDDREKYWYHSATMLHTFLLTMRGTPFFYYGEEIGMTNIRFNSIDQYKDINTINKYKQLEALGENLEEYIEDQKEASRDNARTPMQWDDSENAGFTSSTPWIEVNSNFEKGINVASQDDNENSVLNYFKRMTRIRKLNLGLVYGKYDLLDVMNSNVYAYTRIWEKEYFLILLNFSAHTCDYTLDKDISSRKMKVVISNEENIALHTLAPYQAIVYQYE